MADDFGKNFASWQVLEYVKDHRTFFWYIGFGVIASGLIIYAIWSINYLFAIIIILALFIIYLQHKSEASKVLFSITSKGIQLGKRTYYYKDLRNFWIIYDPPSVKKLYFSFKSNLTTRLVVPLKNQNPLKIRDLLLKFLDEDLEREEEPISEVFAKWSKL